MADEPEEVEEGQTELFPSGVMDGGKTTLVASEQLSAV